MNPLERGIKYGALVILPTMVAFGVSCTSAPAEISPPPPTNLPPAFSPTAQAGEVATSQDLGNKRLIEQARGGEVITIENGLIKRIIRFPWITGTALVATLDSAVLTQADCVYEALRVGNKLGNENLGSWKPLERVDILQARMAIPTSAAFPVPFLDLQKIVYRGKSFICHQVTAGEELKKLLAKVNWKNIPEDIGTVLGNITRQFIDGLRRGLKSPEQSRP